MAVWIASAARPRYSAAMSATPDDLFRSPDHYLQAFDAQNALFVPMDRAAYHRSIFLDRRISPAPGMPGAVPVARLTARPALPVSWIFHMAHCGSTLLARALDDPAGSLVLREPQSLRQTALGDHSRLPLVLAMLGKRYRDDAPTVVKANVPVNFILPQIAEADLRARAILLHLPLRAYLLAILRSDFHRNWVRNVTGLLAQHLGDLSALSDAERAAALWLAQMDRFAEALAAMPNAVALNAETLFADPAPVLKHAAHHLGVPIADAALDAAVAGPLFATYSKDPSRAFDNADRVARNAELERTISPELDAAEAWISRQGRAIPIL